MGQEIKEKDILKYFSKYGKVEHVDLKRNMNDRSKGFAFIVFKDVETLNKVLAKSGHIIQGRKIHFAKAAAHGTVKRRGGFKRGRGKFGHSGRGAKFSDRGGFRGGFRGRGNFRGRGGFHSGFGGPQIVLNYNYA